MKFIKYLQGVIPGEVNLMDHQILQTAKPQRADGKDRGKPVLLERWGRKR